MCRAERAPGGGLGDSTRPPACAPRHRVRRAGRGRHGARAQLLHRLRAIVAADRAVQGRTARVHAGTAQHRGPQCKGHCRRPDRGIRAVLLKAPLPANLAAAIDEAWARVRATPGMLTEREARFLALVAACAPAQGVILEIGSFKGKSTVGLASVAMRYGVSPVSTVVLHSGPSVTEPDVGPRGSSWDDFRASLRAAGVESAVEAHRAY